MDELGVIDMNSHYEAGAEPVKWWDRLQKQACRQHDFCPAPWSVSKSRLVPRGQYDGLWLRARSMQGCRKIRGRVRADSRAGGRLVWGQATRDMSTLVGRMPFEGLQAFQIFGIGLAAASQGRATFGLP